MKKYPVTFQLLAMGPAMELVVALATVVGVVLRVMVVGVVQVVVEEEATEL